LTDLSRSSDPSDRRRWLLHPSSIQPDARAGQPDSREQRWGAGRIAAPQTVSLSLSLSLSLSRGCLSTPMARTLACHRPSLSRSLSLSLSWLFVLSSRSRPAPLVSGAAAGRVCRNMQWFRGGPVFKAHRLCVSLNSRLESNKAEEEGFGDQGLSMLRILRRRRARNLLSRDGS